MTDLVDTGCLVRFIRFGSSLPSFVQRRKVGEPVSTVVEGDFEWDDRKARANLSKHGVSFEEATTVFDDPFAVDAPDLYEPDRFVIIGLSSLSRVLFVVHVIRGDRLRIISARAASAAQRRKYEENPG